MIALISELREIERATFVRRDNPTEVAVRGRGKGEGGLKPLKGSSASVAAAKESKVPR